MKKIIEDIKLRIENLKFVIAIIPIFIEDYKKEKERRDIYKRADDALQEKMIEERYHKMNRWTRWGTRK